LGSFHDENGVVRILDNRILSCFIGGDREIKQSFTVTFVNNALKEISSQNKKKGRKRISLSHSTSAMEVFSRHSIKKDGRGS
jgi:hypothetical protein